MNEKTTRVDIGLRVLIDAPSYKRAGAVMDDLQDAITEVLSGKGVKGHFDFTHINTRPCKAQRMAALAEMAEDDDEIRPDRVPF